ncbi:DYNLRB1, partial [Symbiodinium sp. KB8]
DEGPPDIDASMKPLLQLPGVTAYMVINEAGIPIKWSAQGFKAEEKPAASTIPPEITHHAALLGELSRKCKQTCHELWASDGTEAEAMDYVRLRTDKNEIIIAPGDSCTLVVMQAANEAEEEDEAGEVGEADE